LIGDVWKAKINPKVDHPPLSLFNGSLKRSTKEKYKITHKEMLISQDSFALYKHE
jgi:hypothetical protein